MFGELSEDALNSGSSDENLWDGLCDDYLDDGEGKDDLWAGMGAHTTGDMVEMTNWKNGAFQVLLNSQPILDVDPSTSLKLEDINPVSAQ